MLRKAFTKKFTPDLNVLELREFACTLLRLTETVSPVVQPLVAPCLVKLWTDFNFQWLGAFAARFMHMLREAELHQISVNSAKGGYTEQV